MDIWVLFQRSKRNYGPTFSSNNPCRYRCQQGVNCRCYPAGISRDEIIRLSQTPTAQPWTQTELSPDAVRPTTRMTTPHSTDPDRISGAPAQPGSPAGAPGTPGIQTGTPGRPGNPAGTPWQPGAPGSPGGMCALTLIDKPTSNLFYLWFNYTVLLMFYKDYDTR